MGQQRDSSYYDEIYQQSDHYNRPAIQAAWYPLWAHVTERVPENARVLDVGCGPGQFYEVVYDRAKDYLGLDFSPEAVRRAQHRAPGARFELVDLANVDLSKDYLGFDTYVFCEVLEHIENDLALLAGIPKGRLVILTVPSFDDPSHVRFFSSLPEAAERYMDLLDFRVTKRVENWFLIVGITKGPRKP